MKSIPKTRPVRLDHEPYERLRRQVLERDGWRCQHCGRRDQLEVHHIRFRSAQGEDNENNMMTLCRDCHDVLHLTGKSTSSG